MTEEPFVRPGAEAQVRYLARRDAELRGELEAARREAQLWKVRYEKLAGFAPLRVALLLRERLRAGRAGHG
jgi:hypothetical protein